MSRSILRGVFVVLVAAFSVSAHPQAIGGGAIGGGAISSGAIGGGAIGGKPTGGPLTLPAAPHYRVSAQNDIDVGNSNLDTVGGDYNVCSAVDSAAGSSLCLNTNTASMRGVLKTSGCKVNPCWDFGTGDFIGGSQSTIGLPSDFDFMYSEPTICHYGVSYDVRPTGLAGLFGTKTLSGATRGHVWTLDARVNDRVFAATNSGAGSVYPTYVSDCWAAIDPTDPTLVTMSILGTGAGDWTMTINGVSCATGTSAYAGSGVYELGINDNTATYALASEVYFMECETETSAGSVAAMQSKASQAEAYYAALLGVTLP